MKRSVSVTIGLLLCFGPWVWALAGELEPYPANAPAPSLELQDLDNEMRTLADYRGKVVLVNFWASWC